MRKQSQILIFLFIIAPILCIGQKAVDSLNVLHVDSEHFKELMKEKDAVLLDVRTKSEFNAEHIEGAGQLNYYAFDFKKKLELLPKDKAILLYCNTGYRSRKAGEYLIKKGYSEVYNLEYGIMEWNLLEFHVIEGDRSQIDKENFMSISAFKKLISSDTLIFIDFYAPWCAPCRKMMPMIDSLKTEYHGKVKIVKINADISKKLVKELQLIGVPYFALFRKNKKLFERSGMIKREEITDLFLSELTGQ